MTKNKKTNVVLFERFESLAAFADKLEGTPAVSHWQQVSTEYGSQCLGDKNFFGTSTWEEACDLLKFGDLETAKNITQVSGRAKIKTNTTTNKTSIINNYYGGVPNVPRFLAGSPQNMFDVKTQKYSICKVLTLCVTLGAHYTTSASSLANYGANILNIINTLEKKGYRLNIYVCKVTYFKKSNNYGVCVVKIKDAGKPLNLTRVAYPLTHPAMFRRHFFKWYEIHKELKSPTYGSTASGSETEDIIKQYIQNALVTSFMEDGYKDTDEILRALEMRSNSKF